MQADKNQSNPLLPDLGGIYGHFCQSYKEQGCEVA
jgi:hypothetical protein